MDFLLPLARQWVAGNTSDEGLRRARVANGRGLGAILNFLGEHYTRRESVEATLREYRAIIAGIDAHGLDAAISIKPTQLGLGMDEDYCRENLEDMRERCQAQGVFLWLDMEDTPYTSATLRIYEETSREYAETGVALQANLHRAVDDLRAMMPNAIIRLVKGAYREDPRISYRRKTDIDENYRVLMRILFEEGRRFALATHDDAMIQEGLTLQEEYQRTLEFQTLMGVRDPLKRELRTRGLRTLEYIPYGPHWFAYFTRRLRERPRNAILMMRSFVRS
ncbi:MAG: proline dehydrogenase family protein [Candidatus Thermoplasmatota archaeon]|nr:proline dehydrogenase family protein [Candidatus Thermoplasmatota archaeon]